MSTNIRVMVASMMALVIFSGCTKGAEVAQSTTAETTEVTTEVSVIEETGTEAEEVAETDVVTEAVTDTSGEAEEPVVTESSVSEEVEQETIDVDVAQAYIDALKYINVTDTLNIKLVDINSDGVLEMIVRPDSEETTFNPNPTECELQYLYTYKDIAECLSYGDTYMRYVGSPTNWGNSSYRILDIDGTVILTGKSKQEDGGYAVGWINNSNNEYGTISVGSTIWGSISEETLELLGIDATDYEKDKRGDISIDNPELAHQIEEALDSAPEASPVYSHTFTAEERSNITVDEFIEELTTAQ